MMKIILIDDEKDALEALEWKIKKCIVNDDLNIVKCSSPIIGVNLVKELNPDLVFLDIHMPEMDGFTFLEKFPERNFRVVFTTAHDEYGIKAVKANAIDYLLKPIDIDELQLTFIKVSKQLHEKPNGNNLINRINVSADRKVYLIAKEDVIYLKADKSYTTIFLNTGKKIIVTKTLKEVQKKFDYPDFYRVHNSYVINLNYVTEYNKGGNEITLSNGVVVSVSRRKKNILIDKLRLDK